MLFRSEAAIDGARGVLLNITGPSSMGLFEMNAAAEIIHGVAHQDANIIFGTVIDDTLGDEVKITVIAAGFDGGELPRVTYTRTPEPAVSIPEEVGVTPTPTVTVSSAPAPRRIIFDDTDIADDGLEVPDFLR